MGLRMSDMVVVFKNEIYQPKLWAGELFENDIHQVDEGSIHLACHRLKAAADAGCLRKGNPFNASALRKEPVDPFYEWPATGSWLDATSSG